MRTVAVTRLVGCVLGKQINANCPQIITRVYYSIREKARVDRDQVYQYCVCGILPETLYPPSIQPKMVALDVLLQDDSARNLRALLKVIILITIAAAAVASRLFSVIRKPLTETERAALPRKPLT